MPGRREAGVLDIKAELLDIAVLQPTWAAPALGRELWAAAGDGWRSLRAFSSASPGSAPRQAQGLRGSLIAIASFSESSFLPMSHWAQGTGWVGSCPVLPHHAILGLDHSSSQGWVLEALGQRVPLSPATQPGLWWGESQSHSGKGSRGRSSLGPRETSLPPPPPASLG